MSTRLTYWRAAGYEIVGPTHRVVIDPFPSDNPLAPVSPDELETPDVILVSHAAFDHYGDAARIAKRTGAPVVCDAAVRAMLLDQGVSPDQVSATTWGIVVEAAGLEIRPVECHHWSSGTAEMLGLELAVACHYLEPDGEVDRFLELVPHYDTTGRRRVVAPRVGDTLVVDAESHTIERAA